MQSDRILLLAGSESHSFDLSQATDRFPIEIQKILIKCIFGKDFSDAWGDLMTDRTFHHNNSKLRYGTGQPMGLLSSWCVFALTHHAFVEYCASKVGFHSFRGYAVLGDDVVIWNTKVASLYQDLIQEIGLTINWNKSLVSNAQNTRIEFAKRIYLDGSEVTGLKPTIIKRVWKHIFMFPDLINLLRQRSWDLPGAACCSPSWTSGKRLELLSVLLWDKGVLSAPMDLCPKVNTNLLPTLAELQDKTLEIRTNSLIAKRDSVDSNLSGNKPLMDTFNREGVEVAVHLLNPESGNCHPIVWHINEVGMSLLDKLGKFEEYDKSLLDEECQDHWVNIPIDSIEYLPHPDVTVYYGSRSDLKTKYRSQMVLDAWNELIKEKNPT